MGIMVRNSTDIRGLHMGDMEFKLFQYADDTGFLLDGTEKSLLSALHLLDQFSKFSGLKPNVNKMKCIWLGSKAHSDETLCRERNLCWTEGPFVLLGLQFYTDL